MSGTTGRRLTTPPPPVAVEELVPELAELARTTVRLHPRPGTPEVHESSAGGPLLWPAGEPWPHCADLDRHEELSAPVPTRPVPLVPVLQLFAADVPELPFPDGADVLQVLWCPHDHREDYAPAVTLRWRDAAAVTGPITSPPERTEQAEEDYLPVPCVLSPERVREYPDYSELPDDLQDRVRGIKDDPSHEWSYHYHLSTAPGWKVGGWPASCQDVLRPDCAAGHPMEYLLTIASGEFDGESWRTWEPREEATTRTDREPVGIMLGDMGELNLFLCRTCPDLPMESVFACS
ncbi:hypothetical protein GCM10022221_54380 [Actinocorallia aurea]